MNNLNFYAVKGNFAKNENNINFNGKYIKQLSEDTQEEKLITSTGMIVFSEFFKEGSICCDIKLDDVSPDARFGIVIGYKKINNAETYYQCTISNKTLGYSFDYWNGSGWEIKAFGGTEGTLEKNKTYRLKLEKRGNEIKFFINEVLLYTYTNLLELSGSAGIFIHNAFTTIIENINIVQDKPKVFAIMKFEKDFNDLYKEIIVPQFEKHGYKVVRADECYTATSIIYDITREITEASIIIADITMDNPNVFYEVGYAHALKKTTILLADMNKREILPFDVSGFRTIFYSNSIGGKTEIENTLTKYIENIHREK